MTSDVDEGELSDPPGSEDEADELEREADAARAETDAQLKQTAEELSPMLQSLEARTFHSEALDAVIRSDSSDPLIGVASSEKSDRSEELAEKEAKKDKELAGKEKAQQEWTVKRGLGVLLGLVVAGVSLAQVIEQLARQASGQDDADVPLPDDVKKKIAALYAAWQDLPDDKLWNALADYVDGKTNGSDAPVLPTIADQIYFMKLIEQLAPLQQSWLYDRSQDEADLADSLVTDYHQSGEATSAMYRAIPATTYKSKPLPRAVAADLLRLALSWVCP